MKKIEAEEVRRIQERMYGLDYISPESIPGIDLYMDQITTFMDSQLKNCKRYPEEKILTKTMINNYTKNTLIPPPVKKKYSKDHLLLLIFVYYLKDFMSISDIQEILAPLIENYYSPESPVSLTDIYDKIFALVKGKSSELGEALIKDYRDAESTFDELKKEKGTEDDSYLDTFAFICTLSFDIYAKKKLLEFLIDEMKELRTEKKKN